MEQFVCFSCEDLIELQGKAQSWIKSFADVEQGLP